MEKTETIGLLIVVILSGWIRSGGHTPVIGLHRNSARKFQYLTPSFGAQDAVVWIVSCRIGPRITIGYALQYI